MEFEPQKFFIGLVDFFSILLPGAVLTYLLRDQAALVALGKSSAELHGAEAWVVFLFSSYLLGHFLFLVGSLLDDLAYNPLRRSTKRHPPAIVRWIAAICFKKDPDTALDKVAPLKESYLARIQAPGTINAFQWSKARLAITHPEALAAVNRLEADSKFFRSLVPILIGWLAVEAYQGKGWLSLGLLAMLALAFWRYAEQRFKSTQQAYWTILTLEADQQAGPVEASQPRPTHAGGVVFRSGAAESEYLLVEAKKEPGTWVLPKGHIEPEEDPRCCAIREVKEETGVWAQILDELATIEYALANKDIRTRFYLMESVEEGVPAEPERRHIWLPFSIALDRAAHRQNRELLELAEQIRRRCAP